MQVTAARPYVWPFDGDIDPAQTALLLFTGDTSDLPPEQPWHQVQRLASAARNAGIKLVILPRSGSFDMAPFKPDFVIERPSIGAFWGSDADLVLRNAGLTHLLIT